MVKFGYTKFADFFDNDRQTFDQLSATFQQFKNWPNWIVSTSGCTSTYYKFTRYKSAINVMNRNNTISISFVTLVLLKLNIASFIIIIIDFAIKSGLRVWRKLVPFDKSQLMRF